MALGRFTGLYLAESTHLGCCNHCSHPFNRYEPPHHNTGLFVCMRQVCGTASGHLYVETPDGQCSSKLGFGTEHQRIIGVYICDRNCGQITTCQVEVSQYCTSDVSPVMLQRWHLPFATLSLIAKHQNEPSLLPSLQLCGRRGVRKFLEG